MAELFALISAGLLILALPGLANPALVGWKSRRDAAVVLAIAIGGFALAWLSTGRFG